MSSASICECFSTENKKDNKSGFTGVGLCVMLLISVLQIWIAVNILGVLMYTIDTHFKDWHVLLGMGYHFFTLEALLSLHMFDSMLYQLDFMHKSIAHSLLQMIAVGCVITSSIIITSHTGGISAKEHGAFGIAAIGCSLFCVLTGPLSYFYRSGIHLVHTFFAIPTLLCSCVCICLGLEKESFYNWAGKEITHFHIALVCITTILAIGMILVKCALDTTDDEDDYYGR